MEPTHKAQISPGYRWRLGIIAIATLAMGAYFVYDGAIGYPHIKAVYEAYNEAKDAPGDNFQATWEARVQKEGWDVDLYTTPPHKDDGDIFTQFLMAGLCGLIGLPILALFLHTYLRWVASDGQGLRANGGKHAPWDTITRVDKARWKSKGIAVVQYAADGGQRTITLDDWKFQAQPTRDIMREIEMHIDRERIDGELELPPEEEPAPLQVPSE